MTVLDSYVYLWYDTKAKFFYLGGHKGRVEDSYVCSNRVMLNAYKKRPETFKFRVLEFCSYVNLRNTEQKWLNRIKDHEFMTSENVLSGTCRYYNVKKNASGGNGIGTNKGKSHPPWNKGLTKATSPKMALIAAKSSKTLSGISKTPEHRAALSKPKRKRRASVSRRSPDPSTLRC